MLTCRKILYLLVSLALAACSAVPADAPALAPNIEAPDPSMIETPASKSPPAKPGALADSVPAAFWKDNSTGHLLIPIDPATGGVLPGYEPISLGQSFSHAFSPDGHTLATVGFVSSEHPHGGSLHLVDLVTWKEQVYELRLEGYVTSMDFSPDGEEVGIAYGNNESRVIIFDLPQGSITAESSVDFQSNKMKFTSDGSGLMVYGFRIENRYTANEMSPDPPIAVLLDSADLSVTWTTDLAGVRHGVVPKDEKAEASTDLHQPGQAIYLFPGLSFAPNGDRLYVVHPDEDKLTTVDFDAQKVSTVLIQPRLSWFERLLSLTAGVAHAKVAEGTSKQTAISPDGQFLYIVGQQSDLLEDKAGNWQVIENPLGLQIVRTEDGSRQAYYDIEAKEISISPDGHSLYLRGWGESQDSALRQAQDSAWTQIFDTATNQSIERMDGMWLMPTRRANGVPVLASSLWVDNEKEHHNALVDSRSVLVEWKSKNYIAWLTIP